MLHLIHGASVSISIGETKIDKIGEHWENKGALTGVDERMHYLLGPRNWLRHIKEYKILSKKYNSIELRAICSLRERSQPSLYPIYKVYILYKKI